MKFGRSLSFRLLACALGAFAAPSAHGGTLTYSETPQSRVVRSAIDALERGDESEFRALLTDDALAAYSNPSAIQALRAQYRRQATQTSSIETQSDKEGLWNGDTLVLLSSRVYPVNVLGRRASSTDALDPIWNVSVKCYTFSLTDGLGGPAGGCRISSLSEAVHPQGSTTPAVSALSRGKALHEGVSYEAETPTAGLGNL